LVDTQTGDKEAVTEVSDERQQAWDAEMEVLRKGNQRAGYLHLVQGMGLLFISLTNDTAKAYTLPITSLFQNWDNGGVPVQVLETQHRFALLRYTAAFALMSAAAHFTVLHYWDRYTSDLKKGMNRFRWYEYSISGSLIMTLLFVLWGNFDFVQVSGCFFSQALTMLFGDLMETLNYGKKPSQVDWTPFLYGAVTGVIPWLVMIGELLRSPNKEDIPTFVWLFVLEYFVAFWIFPYTMLRQYAQWGKYNNELYPLLDNGGYLQGERTYIFLSLATKSLILWQVSSGVLRGNDWLE